MDCSLVTVRHVVGGYAAYVCASVASRSRLVNLRERIDSLMIFYPSRICGNIKKSAKNFIRIYFHRKYSWIYGVFDSSVIHSVVFLNNRDYI